MKRTPATAAVIAAALLIPLSMAAQEPDSDPNPLAPFEHLIGGQWHLEGSYQEFEWGVGQKSVKVRGYFVVEGEPKLVSEGIWFWDPADRRIEGVFTAIDMPVEFFEYVTRFEGNKMVNDLNAYNAGGKKTVFSETWEFIDESTTEWKLFSDTPDGEKVMGGTYTRK